MSAQSEKEEALHEIQHWAVTTVVGSSTGLSKQVTRLAKDIAIRDTKTSQAEADTAEYRGKRIGHKLAQEQQYNRPL